MLGNFRPLHEILVDDQIFRGVPFLLRALPSKFNLHSTVDRPVIFGDMDRYTLRQDHIGFEKGQTIFGVRIYDSTQMECIEQLNNKIFLEDPVFYMI